MSEPAAAASAPPSASPSASPPFVNVHGRKPGRGPRPWLLLPKVAAVGVLIGSLAASVVIAQFVAARMAAGVEPTLPMWCVDLLRTVFLWLVVPATVAAILLGIALTWMHGPAVMLRQRWLQVKLLLLAVAAPVGHVTMVTLLGQARAAAEAGAADAASLHRFSLMAGVVLSGVIVLMVLGRHKPRLGRNQARTLHKTGAAVLLLATLASCATQPVRHDARHTPGDFALDLLVIAAAESNASNDSDRLHRTARYVLEPNRRLHVGIGRGAVVGGFPPAWRMIEPADVADLWRHVHRDHLLAEPTSPLAEQQLAEAGDAANLRPPQPIYRIRIIAAGREHQYWTTPQESPPSTALLRRLLTAAALP
jgi:hypothetical protein